MKNSLFLIIVLLLGACTKTESPNPEKLLFEHAVMRPWFDTHCASCHGTGKNNYLLWHYNPEDFEATFDHHNMEHIYELVYEKKRMPKNKNLSSAEIEVFKAWFDAGFKSK